MVLKVCPWIGRTRSKLFDKGLCHILHDNVVFVLFCLFYEFNHSGPPIVWIVYCKQPEMIVRPLTFIGLVDNSIRFSSYDISLGPPTLVAASWPYILSTFVWVGDYLIYVTLRSAICLYNLVVNSLSIQRCFQGGNNYSNNTFIKGGKFVFTGGGNLRHLVCWMLKYCCL